MPKKERYSTSDQIINALLKKGKLDDSKYQELQNAIKMITASNVDNVVRDYLNRCLTIKQDVSNLLTSINEANTSDAIKKLREKISSIDNEIKEIDINQIKLGIETKKVKTQINSIKENFQLNIGKFKKELKQKENEVNKESLKDIAQERELQQQVSSSSVELKQPPTEKTGAVPKQRNSNNKERNKQFFISLRKEKEQKDKQEAERLQKEKEKNYPNFKEKLTNYLEMFNIQIIFSLFYEIKKHTTGKIIYLNHSISLIRTVKNLTSYYVIILKPTMLLYY